MENRYIRATLEFTESARDTSKYSESTRHLELKKDLREHPNITLDTSSSHSASAAWIELVFHDWA